MSVRDLARSLASAGWARKPPDAAELSTFAVKGGNLVHLVWAEDSLESESGVALDVRDGTSAAYLHLPDQDTALLFFLDHSNKIQCYAYSDETEEWEHTALCADWGYTIGPNSKLAAGFSPNGEIVISYQTREGDLAGIIGAGTDGLTTLAPLEAQAASGTPQRLELIDEKLHLFYVGKDGSLHYIVLDCDERGWGSRPHVLENTYSNTRIDNSSVAKEPKTGHLQSYILTANSLWYVDGPEQKSHLGGVNESGRFTPLNNAQFGGRFYWWPRKPRWIVYVTVHYISY